MGKKYKYFKRDMSWLSFNYRVLLEAADKSLPIYERIKFLSIYSSNMEEFYAIRVAEHRGVIMRKNFTEEADVKKTEETLAEITGEVNRQQHVFYQMFNKDIMPELRRQHIYLYQDSVPKPFHEAFVRDYFVEEVFPFLTPVSIQEGLRTFIRDRRLYLVVRMRKKTSQETCYELIKIPYAKVPRFVRLPEHEGVHYSMFIDDIIRVNLSYVFPGYEIEGCYSIKISRDADIYLEKETPENILQTIRTKVKKRKIGALSRFVYDEGMPADFLRFICNVFEIRQEDLVVGGRYLNMHDLNKLPNPFESGQERYAPVPMRIPYLDGMKSVFKAVEARDVLLQFPYQSFDYLIRFLKEAALDTEVEAVKITQYRVAEDSTVIDSLIAAAQNGKKVTVFVELKARFDEENNMSTAERMKRAGIKIIYSIPGLKVHAKVAMILRKGSDKADFAYLGTGNFNEKTAEIYSDMALLTCDKGIVADINEGFAVLEGLRTEPVFHHLLVARFNMVPELLRLIQQEIDHVKAGKSGKIILKMNGLHDERMIDELYRASENGVEIELIVRGICCLVPYQPYSRNIHITRIVDMFLEHARVWYFYNDGAEDLYLTSSDWMNRNLTRRIETACPVRDAAIKKEIIKILQIQLSDNVKACFLDEKLQNVFKRPDKDKSPVRAQMDIYEHIRKNEGVD